MRLDEIEEKLARQQGRTQSVPHGPLLPDSPAHGTVNGYSRHGCRCDRCKAAHSRAMWKWRQKKKGTLREDSPLHGTQTAYTTYGCRCDRCRAARTVYDRDYYLRRKAQRAVDASGEGGNQPVGKVQARTAR